MNIFKISRSYLSNKNKNKMAKLHSYISIFGIMFGITALIVVNASMKGFSNHLTERFSYDVDVSFVLKKNVSETKLGRLIQEIKEDEETKTINNFKGSNEHIARLGSIISLDYYTFEEKDVPFVVEPDTVYLPELYKSFVIGYLNQQGFTGDEESKLKNLYLPIEIKKGTKLEDQSIFKVKFEDYFKGSAFYFSEKTFNEHFFVKSTVPNTSILHVFIHDKIKAIEFENKFKNDNAVERSDNVLKDKKHFVNSIKLEQLLIKIVLFFIVLVSAFNIISTMTLIITEKKQDIYLLKTIGYSNRSVLSIFLITGIFYGLIGILLGTILGWVITLNLYEVFRFFEWLFNIVMIPVSVEGVPYMLLKDDLILINGVTLVIVIIASLIPAMQTLKMTPAEGLKDE